MQDWAYLAAVSEPPSSAVAALVAEVGVSDAVRAISSRVVPAGHHRVLAATEARYEYANAATDLARIERLGGRLLTRDDDDWPGWSLHALTRADTSARAGVPLVLWCRGAYAISDATERAVSLVGARACTDYGTHMSTLCTGQLADRGYTCISGGAYGIDAAVHRATLSAGGVTVAVLASGLDIDYPASHDRLFTEIARTGVLVSEYAPGTRASKHRFLARNRLVAALGAAVVVVEAGRRSGALSTAAWARKVGVPLGAVPGPATSALSVGTHALIRDGHAQLVDSADAIERLVAPNGDDSLGPRPVQRSTDHLDATTLAVRDAIPAAGGVAIAEISFASGVPVDQARAALATLDIERLVVCDGSLWRLPLQDGSKYE